MKKAFLSLMAGLSLLSSVPVSAALIIDRGVAGQIGDFGLPGKHPGEKRDNDVIMAHLGNGVMLNGFFGANLLTTKLTKLEVTYLGKEASYLDTFSIGNHSNLFINNNRKALGFTQTKVGTTHVLGDFKAGLINFSFDSYLFGNTIRKSVSNGANNSPTLSGAMKFWLGEKDGWIWVGLDDGGSRPADADYDDLVLKMRAVPVPEPATLALMGLGLVGFAAARRRKA